MRARLLDEISTVSEMVPADCGDITCAVAAAEAAGAVGAEPDTDSVETECSETLRATGIRTLMGGMELSADWLCPLVVWLTATAGWRLCRKETIKKGIIRVSD